jgi:hypothetical protein
VNPRARQRGYPWAVCTLRQQLDACEVAIRSHLDADEDILAVGRCEDLSEGKKFSGGAGWTYIMVTNKSLRWAPHADPQFEASLTFDDVTAVSESSDGPYAIAMRHGSITRPRWARARRAEILDPDTRVTTMSTTRTELSFSRRDTKAAVALREQLSRHIPPEYIR